MRSMYILIYRATTKKSIQVDTVKNEINEIWILKNMQMIQKKARKQKTLKMEGTNRKQIIQW